MARSNECPRCKSKKWISGMYSVHGPRNYRLQVDLPPLLGFLDNSRQFPMEADACGECGFVELFVKEPEKLWETI